MRGKGTIVGRAAHLETLDSTGTPGYRAGAVVPNRRIFVPASTERGICCPVGLGLNTLDEYTIRA